MGDKGKGGMERSENQRTSSQTIDADGATGSDASREIRHRMHHGALISVPIPIGDVHVPCTVPCKPSSRFT